MGASSVVRGELADIVLPCSFAHKVGPELNGHLFFTYSIPSRRAICDFSSALCSFLRENYRAGCCNRDGSFSSSDPFFCIRAWFFLNIFPVLSPGSPKWVVLCLLSSEVQRECFQTARWQWQLVFSLCSRWFPLLQSPHFCLSLSVSGSFTVFNRRQSPYSKTFLSSALDNICVPQVMNYSALPLLNGVVLFFSYLMNWGETKPKSFKIITNLGC